MWRIRITDHHSIDRGLCADGVTLLGLSRAFVLFSRINQKRIKSMTYFYRKLDKQYLGWLSDEDYRQYEVFECGDDGTLDRVYRFSTDAMLCFYRVFRPALLTGRLNAKSQVLLREVA